MNERSGYFWLFLKLFITSLVSSTSRLRFLDVKLNASGTTYAECTNTNVLFYFTNVLLVDSYVALLIRTHRLDEDLEHSECDEGKEESDFIHKRGDTSRMAETCLI